MAQLRITTAVNDDITRLLAKSIIGTPGSGMLYQHKSIDKRINLIKRPFFVELRTRSGLVATCCFCYRDTVNRTTANRSFYIRYFSFKENFRARPAAEAKRRFGKLRDEIKDLLDGGRFDALSGNKSFSYAYVDPLNTRSVLLCNEFGFQEVRRFTTFIFSRLKPKTERAPGVVKIRKEEVPEVKKLLLTKYSGFNMVSFDELFENDSYYVVKDDNGKIVAGAHVSPTHWRIFKMHNRINTLLVALLSHVPLLNRLVNNEFRFLAVDGLYFTEGLEHYTEALLTALLDKYKHNNAFIPADNGSSLFAHLKKLDLGLVSKISKQVSTSVICRFNDFSSEEIQNFKTIPRLCVRFRYHLKCLIMEQLLQRSKEQLLNPLGEARRKLLIILNFVYCVLAPIFLISEKIATGKYTNDDRLLIVYFLAVFLNLLSAIYNIILFRKLKGKPVLSSLFPVDHFIYRHQQKLDLVVGYSSMVPIMIMSFLNMLGFGNPFSDSLLTDFALAHSLMIVVVIILGRVAVTIWFVIVMAILVFTVQQRGWNYRYHYATPTEVRAYQEGLEKKEVWALERQQELQRERLSPPLVSRYFNTWLIFLVVAFLTAYFFSGITIDIFKIVPSVVRNIENALESSKKMELEQKVYEDKTNTFINLAHETKTPLTLINNYLNEYIQKNGVEESEELNVLKTNIEKLTSDMTNFFDIERLDRGFDIYDHNQVANVSRILSTKIPLFKHLAERKRIRLVEKVQSGLYTIAHPSAVERIINNLIENAIKYTQEGGMVTVMLTEIDGSMTFRVRDTGIGIPEALQEKVFEPYFQLSVARKDNDGMGLGLSIVKKIVSNLGGEISMESKEAQGTEVSVSLIKFLPQEGFSEEPFKADSSSGLYIFSSSIADQISDPSKPYILIVEDNLSMLSYLVDKLKFRYNVYAAKSGEEALEKLKSITQLELIISDVMMEPMDGFEFCKELYRIEKYEHLPVIFLTAKTTSEDKMLGLSIGAIDYIEKPFLIPQLIQKIDSVLLSYKKQQVALIKRASKLLSIEYEQRGKAINESIVSEYASNCKRYGLTPREIEIVNLLITGQPYKIIGDTLSISVNTVAKHMSNIFQKVEVSNKMELMNKLHESNPAPADT